MQLINESCCKQPRIQFQVEINALNMFKLVLFLLLSLCAAFAYAAPGLSHLHGHGHILSSSHSYHGWPHAVHVVRPIWTSHTIVRPIIHHNGYGYGHGW